MHYKKNFIHFPFPSYVVLYNVSYFALVANYQLTLRIKNRLFLRKKKKKKQRLDKCIVTYCNVSFEQNTTVIALQVWFTFNSSYYFV